MALGTFLFICLGAAGGTLVIRALMEMFGLLFALAAKPWSCDLCMSWWTSIIASLVYFFGIERPSSFLAGFVLLGFYVLASVPVSMIVLKTIRKLG